MNAEQEQLAEMTHRLASVTLAPFRLSFSGEAPIRLVVSRSVLHKNLTVDRITNQSNR